MSPARFPQNYYLCRTLNKPAKRHPNATNNVDEFVNKIMFINIHFNQEKSALVIHIIHTLTIITTFKYYLSY